jgi:hypothetical protein
MFANLELLLQILIYSYPKIKAISSLVPVC